MPKRPDAVRTPPGRLSAEETSHLFDPTRLTQARHAQGITKRELAGRLQVSPAAIGQYESGTIRPRTEHLQRLADVLGVPVGFFAAGRPRADLDSSMTHFRHLRSTRGYERDQAVTFVEHTWELAYELSRYVRLPRLDLPGWDDGSEGEPLRAEGSDSRNAEWADAIGAAQAIRRRWHLSDEPISHFVRTLESKGIIVTTLTMDGSERISAFSTSRTPRPVVVLTTDRDDVYRHRFNTAHELGHLILHPDALPGDIEHEREADAFAAEFLSPAHKLVRQLPRRLDFAALIRLQRAWGVSVESLLYRSQELGVLSSASHRRGRIQLHQLRASGAVPYEPIAGFAGECPALLARAFEIATERKMTMLVLANALALPTERIRQLLGIQENQRPRLQLVE